MFEVSPGSHVLQLKIDWASSETMRFEVSETTRAKFVCKPSNSDGNTSVAAGFRALYWITWGHRRYIDLQPA